VLDLILDIVKQKGNNNENLYKINYPEEYKKCKIEGKSGRQIPFKYWKKFNI
jgi:hypothetical protein